MDIILPLVILILMSALFVEGIFRKVNARPLFHRCVRNILYYEETDHRGLFCAICHKDIDIEYYSKGISREGITHENTND